MLELYAAKSMSGSHLFPHLRTSWLSAALAAAVAGCGQDPAAPGPGPSVVFLTQPTTAIAGQVIQPPVAVTVRGASNPATVTVTLDPNPCGWLLAGSLAAQVVETVARFPDLSLDKVGLGFTLRASSGQVSAVSAPFDVRSDIVTEAVVLENVLCLKPNPQSDGESLAYVPEDDTFWIADDDRRSIYEVERLTGAYRSEIALSTILEALPDAGQCDDGDGDPTTVCSYVEEFELLAYDPDGGALYVVNTVNTSPPDRPAIFRLTKGACAGCFTPESWQPLDVGPLYSSLVVVEGELFLALRNRLYAYDYATNRPATVDTNGDSLPPAYEAPNRMMALSFDGTFMWILTSQRVLYQVEWATRTQRGTSDLGAFNFADPRGLEIVRDTIYVLESEAPNPIYVLSQRQP